MPTHIIIVGAGMGGLALAHGLRKHNIPFHLYERDATKDSRAQGYRIRNGGEGVSALQYLLDDETWRLFELTCADMKVAPIPEIDAVNDSVEAVEMGPKGNEARKDFWKGLTPYTVDRTMFREVLLRGLEADGHVSYGKVLDRYEVKEDGIVTYFTDGTSKSGTLLVGADGANSAVRQQLLPKYPYLDTGGRCLWGKTPITPDLLDTLEPTIMQGMSAVKDRSNDSMMTMVLEPVIFTRREQVRSEGFDCPGDYLYWVIAMPPEAMGLSTTDPVPRLTYAEAEQLALKVSEDWLPSRRCIVQKQAPGQTAFMPIYSCPAELPTWSPSDRVTLLGDAVHLSGPSGSGAITALRDAGLLCRLLAQGRPTKEAVAEYEQDMREYASGIIGTSWKVWGALFGKEARDSNLGELMMKLRQKRTQEGAERSA
ncbi:hypothetical protein B0A50_02131 [Salinomyces thailandicus]|uniref:FAD-binding domain-containing protein n=1 Tax=Salinomyces thailandicus TaxID=706561 RepID=A0A4U0UA09_9PEZI|nr:hypothetical protein B0A50_02131 [Salinomyces thailandica]